MDSSPTVLITGASSGFGEATAKLLAARGMRVFGTSRRAPASGKQVADNFVIVQLDVRDPESVGRCVATVMEAGGRIDVLVNNAGYALAGAVEETSIEEAQAQFDTNFFGAMRMIQAVLPIMRAQGQGRIINITSLAGMIGVPFHTFYSASKFALEGLSEGLRHEAIGFGVHVTAIKPGDFKTEGTSSRVQAAQRLAAYANDRDRAVQIMAKAEQAGPDPERLAKLVARIINKRKPKARYRIGMDSAWVPRLRAILPEAFFEYAIRKNYRIGEPGDNGEAGGG